MRILRNTEPAIAPASGGGSDAVTPPVIAPETTAGQPPEGADTPPPEAELEAAAVKETSDVLLSSILTSLKGEEPVVAEEVVPAPEVEPPAAVVAAEPAKPAEPPKPRAKKGITQPPAPPIPEPVAPAVATPPPSQPPQPTAPAKDDDADYIATLTEDQREELREAEVAERVSPEKYKDQRKKLLSFFKTYDTKAPEIQSSLDGEELGDNAEFKKLMDGKPKLTASDSKRVQRVIGKEEATVEVKRELEPKIAANDMRLRELEARPKVLAEVGQMDAEINKLFVADVKSPLHTISKLFAEKGAKAIEENPDFQLEVSIASQHASRMKRLAAEYLLFKEGARSFDSENPVHIELINFVEDQGDALQAAGGLVRGGKRFLTRTQYVDQVRSVGADAASKKYFTFTDDDVKRLLVEDTKKRIEKAVNSTIEQNTKLGFTRQPKAASAPARTEPAPLTPPIATPSRAKGPATTTPATQADQGINVVNVMGYK